MAELVDAQVSGTCDRKVVEVRVLFWAPFFSQEIKRLARAFRSPSLGQAIPMSQPDTSHISLYHNDLPDDLDLGAVVAIDSEAMGLNNHRDRLTLVQLSSGDGRAHLVQLSAEALAGDNPAPNLCRLLADPNVLKLFHFARFDVALFYKALGVVCAPVYCTKIASKMVRTYTDRHGLKDLTKELIGADISKQQQSSDWGAAELSAAQMVYAADDVLYLHAMKEKLDARLQREGRAELAQACFDFLPTRAQLDLLGWDDPDIFAHR